MKRAAIAGAVVLALVLVVGGGIGARQALSPSTCQKPLVFFDSDSQRAIIATDDYIDANIAELYEKPATVNWITAEANVRPGKISARVAVGETETGFLGYVFTDQPRMYVVELVKECSGGEWKVVKFELAKGEPPEPNAGGAAPKPSSSG